MKCSHRHCEMPASNYTRKMYHQEKGESLEDSKEKNICIICHIYNVFVESFAPHFVWIFAVLLFFIDLYHYEIIPDSNLLYGLAFTFIVVMMAFALCTLLPLGLVYYLTYKERPRVVRFVERVQSN